MRFHATTLGHAAAAQRRVLQMLPGIAATLLAGVLALSGCVQRKVATPGERPPPEGPDRKLPEYEKTGAEREDVAAREKTIEKTADVPGTGMPPLPPGEKPPALRQPTDPSLPRMPTWPPKGRSIRLPVMRDAWVSCAKGETRGNTGGASRLKTKGCQEFTLFDIDPSPLLSDSGGKIVTGALWHFHSATPDAPFLRVTVSTVATPWTEGTSSGYKPQEGGVCFDQAALSQRDWAYPGSNLLDAAWGRGHTMWRFSESSPPDAGGWSSCAVEPAVVAARLAGLSSGFAVYDDVGNVWDMKGGEFHWHYFPNRFVHSREEKRFAPYLEVWTDGEDREPPEAVTDIVCETAGFPAGEALVRWKTPPDPCREGRGAGTLGFTVTYRAGGAEKEMPRYLIPMAGLPGSEVRMHIQDLEFKPGERLDLTIRPVDGAGNVGEALTKTVTLSGTPRVFKIARSDIKPFNPSTSLPTIGGLRVSVVDLLDKIHPKTGEMIPEHSRGYKGGNHIWSAARKLVRLHAARNEAVCFQVNLEGKTAAASVEFAFPSPNDDAGLQTKLFRFDYVRTKAGPMPDALVPLEGPVAIPAKDDPEAAGQRNASLLCEVYVPHDTPPGKKTGKLAISDKGRSLEITVELTVWDFTLPDKLSFIPEMNCYGTAGPTGVGLEYYRLAHEHRCCLNRLYYNWRGRPSREPRSSEDGFDWTEWDRDFSPLFVKGEGSAFKDLPRKGEPVDCFYLPFNENWPVDVHAHYKRSYWVEEAFLPGYKEKLKSAFGEFARHFDGKGWHDTIFEFYLNNKVYNKKGRGWKGSSAPWILDEPSNTQDFWALRWYGILFHQAVDPVRGGAKMWYRCDVSRTQFGRNMFWGVMDIEVLGGANPQKVRMRRDERVLWSRSYFTEYGSANDPALPNTQPVAWCLATWSDGAEGVLPWQTIGSEKSWREGEATCVFYPREGGPVPSVRLKAFRRGQQIVEYLTLLGETYRQPHFAVVGGAGGIVDLRAKIIKRSEADAGTIRFRRSSPTGLWELRYRLGKMVAAKRPPYKRCVKPMPSPDTDMDRLPDIGYVSVGPIAPRLPRAGDKPYAPPAPAAPAPTRPKAPARAPARTAGGDWTPIFNGMDLSGWRKAGNAHVENGALVSENDADVFYPADWTEFVLSCEVKAAGGMGLHLAHWQMGRGSGRVRLLFHPDGDVHVRGKEGGMLGKTGSGKFVVKDWTPVTLELTRETCRLYRGDELVTTVDCSREPVRKGGIYFFAHGAGKAEMRNVRVKVLSR